MSSSSSPSSGLFNVTVTDVRNFSVREPMSKSLTPVPVDLTIDIWFTRGNQVCSLFDILE